MVGDSEIPRVTLPRVSQTIQEVVQGFQVLGLSLKPAAVNLTRKLANLNGRLGAGLFTLAQDLGHVGVLSVVDHWGIPDCLLILGPGGIRFPPPVDSSQTVTPTIMSSIQLQFSGSDSV